MTGDPGAADEAAKVGSLSIRIGLGWAKSHSFTTGQTPGHEVPPRADADDPQRPAHTSPRRSTRRSITLDEAPQGYEDFDKGAAKKFVLDPHGLVKT